mmetsp:Transcript_24087/g.40934  ORF Transcript_24087/g.40934 Transcript_24087/m.40934 type:complete len:407 (+) Transcript_24087:115-1335(+)
MADTLQAEIELMECAEKGITDIQDILSKKLKAAEPTLKKAMDIEEFLYEKAKSRFNVDNVWESRDASDFYKDSLQKVLDLMVNRSDLNTDWLKLFKSETAQVFLHRLKNVEYTITTSKKRKAAAPAQPVFKNTTIPHPNDVTGADSMQQNTSKKATSKKIGKKAPRITPGTIPAPPSASPPAPAPAPAIKSTSSQLPSQNQTQNRNPPVAKSNNKPVPTAKVPVKTHVVQESFPKITELMRQDSTSSMDEYGLSASNARVGSLDDSLMLTAQEDEDSLFARATLENSSRWKDDIDSSTGTDLNGNTTSVSPSQSAWNTAQSERLSQVQQIEDKQKHQLSTEEERRRLREESHKDGVAKGDQNVASSTAPVVEDMEVIRAREREKRQRESKEQTVFMGEDLDIPYYE